jgi:hypothetical protein
MKKMEGEIMPWTGADASRHTKKAQSSKKKKTWSKVANSVLRKTGNEGRAIREANAVVKKSTKKKAAKKASKKSAKKR